MTIRLKKISKYSITLANVVSNSSWSDTVFEAAEVDEEQGQQPALADGGGCCSEGSGGLGHGAVHPSRCTLGLTA